MTISNHHQLGDQNFDGYCNMWDTGFVGSHFPSTVGDGTYDLYADINQDRKVNMVDVGIVASHFGESTPWHLHHKDPELHYQGSIWGTDAKCWRGPSDGGTYTTQWLCYRELPRGIHLYGKEWYFPDGAGNAAVVQGTHAMWGNYGSSVFPAIPIGSFDSHEIRSMYMLDKCSAGIFAHIGIWAYIFAPYKFDFKIPGLINWENLECIEYIIQIASAGVPLAGQLRDWTDAGGTVHYWMLYPHDYPYGTLGGGVNTLVVPSSIMAEDFDTFSKYSYQHGTTIKADVSQFSITLLEFLLECGYGGEAEASVYNLYWYKYGTI